MKALLVLLFLLIPSLGDAETYGDFDYTASRAGVTINRYDGSDASVEIPSKIGAVPVTVIGRAAFSRCESLVRATMPSSVKTIEDYAFDGCVNLETISLSSGLKYIGNRVFGNCQKLTRLTIPKSVARVQQEALSDCPALTWIDVELASPNFKSIDGVLFNKAATSILAYPGGRPGSYAIPSSVTTIGNSAFHWCMELSTVSIPSSVKKILKNAFGGCTSLKSVIIPRNVEVIEEGPFRYCRALGGIVVDQGNAKFKSVDGVLFNKALTTIVSYAPGKPGSYVLPTNVRTIAGEAFQGCENLTSIAIASGVTTIGEQAFSGCTALTNITIPSGVKTIEEDTFSYCFNLATVTMPVSVTRIGEAAFEGCSSLKDITIPVRVTTIGDDAFGRCAGLSVITIPSSVRNLGSNVFEGCENLTGIRFRGSPPRITSGLGPSPENCKAYYLPSSRGWRSSYGGLPTWAETF